MGSEAQRGNQEGKVAYKSETKSMSASQAAFFSFLIIH